MKKVALLVKDVDQQYHALQTGVGLLLSEVHVQMFVLHHEIADMDEAFRDNMDFLDEMGGERYSNHPANIENFGFRPTTLKQVVEKIKAADLVIPF